MKLMTSTETRTTVSLAHCSSDYPCYQKLPLLLLDFISTGLLPVLTTH